MVIMSACHAEGPGSILGNSVKDVYSILFGINRRVAGSIPASPIMWDCSSIGRACGLANARKGTHLVLAEDTYSNF